MDNYGLKLLKRLKIERKEMLRRYNNLECYDKSIVGYYYNCKRTDYLISALRNDLKAKGKVAQNCNIREEEFNKKIDGLIFLDFDMMYDDVLYNRARVDFQEDSIICRGHKRFGTRKKNTDKLQLTVEDIKLNLKRLKINEWKDMYFGKRCFNGWWKLKMVFYNGKPIDCSGVNSFPLYMVGLLELFGFDVKDIL